MSPIRRPFLPVLLAVLLAGTALPAHATDSAHEVSFTLSPSDQSAHLVVELPAANLRFTGTDGDTIRVTAESGATHALPVSLTAQGNRVTLALRSATSAETVALPDLLIRVPHTTQLEVTSSHGRLQLDGLRGDVEISQPAGTIQLTNLTGGIVVNSQSAAITATFTANPTKVIALTTEDGPIDLTLPADTRASVTLRSHRGPIDTDFTAAKFKTRTVKTRPDATAPTPGKVITGTLNGGSGAVLTLATISGRLALRQSAPVQGDPDETKDNVTVRFQDPDRFTDATEDFPGSTSTYYLAELREHVQRIGARRLAPGQSLVITFLDLDLAGYIWPERNNLRILTGGSMPRAHVRFQLLGADGQVLQQGERHLSSPHYQFNTPPFGRDEPLHYDKQMFRDWLEREFPAPAKR